MCVKPGFLREERKWIEGVSEKVLRKMYLPARQ
jgi:hypothetical protein